MGLIPPRPPVMGHRPSPELVQAIEDAERRLEGAELGCPLPRIDREPLPSEEREGSNT